MTGERNERAVTGIVKVWKEEEGYGFIKRDDGGQDVFLHISELKSSEWTPDQIDMIEKGDKLEFEVVVKDRGPRATAIIPA